MSRPMGPRRGWVQSQTLLDAQLQPDSPPTPLYVAPGGRPSLPYELISAILELAYLDPVSHPPPILSKSFLAVYRAILHRRLRIESEADLKRFLRACKKDGERASLVRTLEMERVTFMSVNEPYQMAAPVHDMAEIVVKKQVQAMLASLVNLRTIEFGIWPSGMLLNLDLSIVAPALQHATRLRCSLKKTLAHLDEPTPGPVQTVQDKLCALLEACPSLIDLNLDLDRLVFTETSRSFPRVKRLSVKGAVFHRRQESLYAAFPQVSSLKLVDVALKSIHLLGMHLGDNGRDSIHVDNTKGLDIFPPLIETLSLAGNADCGSDLAFADSSRYPRLRSLSVDLGPFLSKLTNSLSNVPSLEYFAISSGCLLRTSQILDLLLLHVPSLKRFRLDSEQAKMGSRAPEGGPLPSNHSLLLVADDWILPAYDLTKERLLRQAFEKFEEKGIQVTGTTLESLRVVAEWRKERQRCIEIYLASPGAQGQKLNESLVSIE